MRQLQINPLGGYDPEIGRWLWALEDTFRDVTGASLVSASGVSAVTARLWEEYTAFTRRDPSGFAVEYLFLDAIYESLRLQGGGAEGLLCAGRSSRTAGKCCYT